MQEVQQEPSGGSSNGHALLAALELHDPYTARHSLNTVALARTVSRRLGLSPFACAEVAMVAMLHDVGKLGMPDRILGKRGPLNAEELEIVREHPAAGAAVVAQGPELAHLEAAIRAGHERWDGTGYPDGLAGEEIPVASRITFVCDAYDSMTSDRPYSKAIACELALAELRRCSGTQFWPPCVDALVDIVAAREGVQVPAAA